jgi:UDP-glucose 4-epimerase
MLEHFGSCPQKLSRVVLLGGNGFIGKSLVSTFKKGGIEVLTVGSNDIDLSLPGSVKSLENLLQSTDTLVFLSAITPDKGRDAEVFIKNLLMMKHVCAALRAEPVRHVIYFSSDAVYGLRQSCVSEASPVDPADLYGVMHLSREKMLVELDCVPIAILRVTMVYGAGDTHDAYGPNRFFKTALKSKKIDLFGGGEEMRDHIHVSDVAAIVSNCAQMRFTGILNIATGRSSTFIRVAQLIASHFGGNIDISENPRDNPITHRHYDVINLIRAFPFLSFTKIEDGIKSYQGEIS